MVHKHVHVLDHVEICYYCYEAQGGCEHCDGLGGWVPGWYFWDETQSDRYGPFDNKEDAIQEAVKYANSI